MEIEDISISISLPNLIKRLPKYQLVNPGSQAIPAPCSEARGERWFWLCTDVCDTEKVQPGAVRSTCGQLDQSRSSHFLLNHKWRRKAIPGQPERQAWGGGSLRIQTVHHRTDELDKPLHSFLKASNSFRKPASRWLHHYGLRPQWL